MDGSTLLIIGAAIVAFLAFSKSSKGENSKKIPNKLVTRKKVTEIISKFNPELKENLKYGYTEKSVQNQLCAHLRDYFEHVDTEYGIPGLNSTKIDLDVGEGQVGIELKLASKVFKTAEFNRLAGQLRQYSLQRYSKDNLLLGIIGTSDDKKETSWLKQIGELAKEYKTETIFIQVPTKTIDD